MRNNSLLLGLLGAVLATLLALLGHEHLPEKRMSLLPGSELGTFYNLYGDGGEGGPSHSEWVGEENSGHWRCRVEAEGDYIYCGLNIFLNAEPNVGLDLTGYHSVRINLEQRGSDKGLSLFVRHYDAEYSNPADGNSAQFSKFDIPTHELTDDVLVNFSEFTLADWWVAERNLPRELMRPAFSNVVLVGFDYRVPLTPGNHDVIIKRFEVVGDWVSKENWYLAILLSWLGGIVFWASDRLIKLHNATQRHQKRLRLLSNRNQELRQESSLYKELSARDRLTGALNRFGFEQQLSALLHKPESQPLTVILLDIDYFKAFNDTYGHEVGDQVLKHIVYLLEQHTRGRDVLCRWGGEEFLLLCPETNLDSAALLAEKIREIVEATRLEPNIESRLTLSLSVCQIESGESFVDAFGRADRALYEAKGAGRNRVIMAMRQADH